MKARFYFGRVLLGKVTGDHGVGVGGPALLGQLLAPPGQLGAKALDAVEPGKVNHALFQIRGPDMVAPGRADRLVLVDDRALQLAHGLVGAVEAEPVEEGEESLPVGRMADKVDDTLEEGEEEEFKHPGDPLVSGGDCDSQILTLNCTLQTAHLKTAHSKLHTAIVFYIMYIVH